MKEALLVGYEELAKFLKEAKDSERRLKRLISFTKLLVEGAQVSISVTAGITFTTLSSFRAGFLSK